MFTLHETGSHRKVPSGGVTGSGFFTGSPRCWTVNRLRCPQGTVGCQETKWLKEGVAAGVR